MTETATRKKAPKPGETASVNERQRLVDRAKSAQKRALDERKKSPDGLVAGLSIEGNRRRYLINRYVPEAAGKNPSMSVYFDYPGDRDSRLRQNVDKGYEPVLDEHGEYVMDGGDIMFRRPVEFYKAHLANATTLSKKRMAEYGVQDVKSKDGSKVAPDMDSSFGGYSDEQSSVSQGTLPA